MTAPVYEGDPALREAVLHALAGVIDPELSLGIVDIGLVYAVRVDADRVRVSMTMTTPACPVADVVAGDVEAAVRGALPDPRAVEVEMVWRPAWTPARMSERARRAMGW